MGVKKRKILLYVAIFISLASLSTAYIYYDQVLYGSEQSVTTFLERNSVTFDEANELETYLPKMLKKTFER